MRTIPTRIARLAAATALAAGLGLLGAGPAMADGSTWAGSVPEATTSAATDPCTARADRPCSLSFDEAVRGGQPDGGTWSR